MSKRARRSIQWALAFGALLLAGCGGKPDPDTAVMLIESSPVNLDPRIGVDVQSERIDMLIFDSLVKKDEHFELHPWLAKSWDQPDPTTYVFHLQPGVHFHNGKPLTSADVKWSIDSAHNGTVITAKSGTFIQIDHVDAPDPLTCVVHLKTGRSFPALESLRWRARHRPRRQRQRFLAASHRQRCLQIRLPAAGQGRHPRAQRR